MKIIVTGGAGFIGTNMVVALHDAGLDVIALDSLSRSGAERNLHYLRSRIPDLDFRRCESEMWGISPRFERWRPADQKVFYCDLRKTAETFGWCPQVSMKDGLAELYEWTESSLVAGVT